MLSVLDELPSTAPLPTLQTRMANERALGPHSSGPPKPSANSSHFREQQARGLVALTNVPAVFGGSKDGQFNKDISELTGTVRLLGPAGKPTNGRTPSAARTSPS